MAHSPLLPLLDSKPYLKFEVTNRFNPVPHPRNQVPYRLRDSISLGEWRAFWFGLEPIRDENRRWDVMFGWGKPFIWMAYLVLLFRWHPWLDWTIAGHESSTLVLYLTSLNLLAACFNVANVALKDAELQPLRIACRAAEDHLFRRHGWAIECDYKRSLCGCRVSETVVYFNRVTDRSNANRSADLGGRSEGKSIEREESLARDGYLRIALLKLEGFSSIWSPISIAHIESFKTLPANLVPRDEQCWVLFLSKLIEQSKTHLTIYRCIGLFNWPIYICLVIQACLVESHVWSDSSPDIAIWLIVGSWFSTYIFAGILVCDIVSLLNEYEKELAQEGLFVECRGAPASESNSIEAVYLYLYPRNFANEATHALPNSGIGSVVQRGGGRSNYTDMV
jgi:hypothetical protein